MPTLQQPDVPGPARLVVLEGDRIGRRFLLDQDVVLVGRDEAAHVRFDDPQLSRRHAEIRRQGQLYTVVDLNSSNGTFVNGAPVRGEAALKLADKVRLGPSVVMLFSYADPIEEQILQRQRLEALGRLGAGIAHDFNNMLAAVLSSIGFLRDHPADHGLHSREALEALEDAHHAGTRAAELSQRLLAFAKGEQQPGNRMNVSDVCRDVVRLVRGTFDRSIAVSNEVEPELWVLGNDMALHQVLTNLCLNARDAMPDGGKLHIAATLNGEEEARREVLLEVSDTGIGMSKVTQDRVFEPFFTTKRAGAGFGLGLATSRDIITNLGGAITFHSVPRSGTIFRLRLPATQPGLPTRRETNDPRPQVDPTQNLRILLVEDEDMVRRSARRVLRHAGHTITEACDGAEGVAVYNAAVPRPDLVLLDLDMPVMGGEQALSHILDSDPRAVVVMTSGHRDHTHEKGLFEQGASGFVRKPWTGAALLKAIALALVRNTATIE